MTRARVGLLHPGTQHSWQTALALQEGGMLAWYATSIFYDPKRWPYRIEQHLPPALAGRVNRSFRRRYEPRLDPALVRRLGPWGWIAAGASAMGGDRFYGWTVREGNRDFGRRAVRLLEREPVDVIWAYDTAALEVFRWAKPRGVLCVLDRTIAHSVTANRLMSEEFSRHPEFFLRPFAPKPPRLLEEEQEELELADLVLAGSRFCADTLIENGCAAAKIRVLSYGFDEQAFPLAMPHRMLARDAPIEFLFAGVASPRKGVAYLLKAFREISPRAARLTLIGRLAIPSATFAKYAENVVHLPQVGRSEIARVFERADCFVFPSRLEGSALVLREIYGAGLGAIHTRAAGEGVLHDENGIIIDEISVAGLVASIERVLDDRGCLADWQEKSWAMRDRFTWTAYREHARGTITLLLESGNHAANYSTMPARSVEGPTLAQSTAESFACIQRNSRSTEAWNAPGTVV